MALLIVIIAILVILAAISAFYFFNPLQKNEIISGKILKKSKFIKKSHSVKGHALIIKKGKDTFLQLKNFYTIRGPDVFLVLSKDLKAKDKIILEKLKVTKGNYFVKIPKNIDLKKYNKVLIWCRAFRVLFSYAILK